MLVLKNRCIYFEQQYLFEVNDNPQKYILTFKLERVNFLDISSVKEKTLTSLSNHYNLHLQGNSTLYKSFSGDNGYRLSNRTDDYLDYSRGFDRHEFIIVTRF